MSFSAFSLARKCIDSLCQVTKQYVRQWTKPGNDGVILSAAVGLALSKQEHALENLLLRQQLIVLRRQVKRLALTWRDRTLFMLLANRLRTWKQWTTTLMPSEGSLKRWTFG